MRNQGTVPSFSDDEVLNAWDGGKCLERVLTVEQLGDMDIAEAYRKLDEMQKMRQDEHLEELQDQLLSRVRGGKINRRKNYSP